MAKTLITNNYKNQSIQNLIDCVEQEKTILYAITGNHIGYTTSGIDAPQNTDNYLIHNLPKNMIFGKRINKNELSFMINNYEWQENIYFDMYDDEEDYPDGMNVNQINNTSWVVSGPITELGIF